MNIGEKLRKARLNSKLTQEQVAEKLGVSRQTISNWENEKTYPDIVNIIELSDLYDISLDDLLKGDQKIIKHLDESTNVVKSNKSLIAVIILNIILFVLFGMMAYLIPDNTYMVATIFSLIALSVGMLLYQIIQRI